MKRHRPSSLRAFKRCPFRALQQYYRHDRAQLSDIPENFLMGSAFHEYAALSLKEEITQFNEHGRYSSAMELECSALWQSAKSMRPAGKILSIEEPYQVNYDDGNILVGIPDLVVQAYDDPAATIILDWKTAFTPQGYEREQFLDYAALLYMVKKPAPDHRFREHTAFVRLGYTQRDEIDGEAAKCHFKVMLQQCRAIDILDPDEPEQWAATPGHICDDCPAATLCPIAEETRYHAGAIHDEAVATKMALEITAIESKLKLMKTALKGWCAEAGPVPLGDGYQHGFRSIGKKVYDAEGIHEALDTDEIAQLFIDGFIKVDGQQLIKLKKSDALAYNAIISNMEIRPQSRFERHKVPTE